ncbi:FUSC family protein [Paenarthrobacter sp. Z7-10]|uniref:FUSC family protein n=1 Tax=Paenarthrobacter sp. Z7-10 TaxID=2787635 RepID=UPI0022A9CE5E|nr:FUSC family protein [Paenarthrobacter sp. Z7-10]MCZ2404949.1 FUSC family protein [Paenarthrobacter sp. Z7-10]
MGVFTAAVPLTGADFAGRLGRGVHRIVGTFAGLGVTAMLLQFRPAVVVLSILVAVFGFPTELFMARHYGLALVFFTPLILIMTVLAHPTNVDALIAARGVETFLGAVTGMAVVLLVRARAGQVSG